MKKLGVPTVKGYEAVRAVSEFMNKVAAAPTKEDSVKLITEMPDMELAKLAYALQTSLTVLVSVELMFRSEVHKRKIHINVYENTGLILSPAGTKLQ